MTQHAALADGTAAAEAARRRAKARGRARLKALGIDVDQMSHQQIRQAWESARAAYINTAAAGLHLDPMLLDGDPLPGACLHARFGILRDSLKNWYGEHPDGWSSPRIDWPAPGEQHAATLTVTQIYDTPPALPAA